MILKGRDPRDAWAFVERICGVCTGIHALAAVRSVEDAIGIKIPKNANIIRNLMNATLYVHDHLVHFYQLSALDWVDVVSALEADPRKTADLQQKISPKHPLASVGYFRDVQNRLKKFVASGQLGIFNKGYWGHPEMKLPPAVNLLAVTHYLEVLDFQKEIVRIHTILGGKNPHPNYLVGGVACPINVHDTGAQGTMVNEVTLNYMRDIAKKSLEMVENVYLPDIKAIASFYPEWFKVGGGLSGKNVLCYGDFPEVANDWSDASLQLPRGAIVDGKWTKSTTSTCATSSRFRNSSTTPGTSTPMPPRVCTPGKASRIRPSNFPRARTARRRSSSGSPPTASTPGSRARAGAAT